MAKKRVLIFSLAYSPLVGGAEVAVKEITDRLRENFEFDMVTLRFSDAHPKFEAIGNVHVYRVGGWKHLFPLTALLRALWLHRENKYRHIWAIMANWAGFAALFFKLVHPRAKFVLTLQEGDPISYIRRKVWFVYPIFKNIFRKADIIQAISNYLADWAKQMGGKRVFVVPNGVDMKKFEGDQVGHEGTVLITTSRLVEKNGVEDIINSLTHLPQSVSLKILGTGPLEAKLRKLATGKRVEFLGLVKPEEIPKYLHEADIFIRPSLSEGMGNSFIEAMAAGLPVIATPVGGIPDFLFDPDRSPQHAPTGLFVNVRDPEDIARQVTRLIKDQKLRETLINNARRLVREKYGWDLIAQRMKERVFELKH